MVGLLFNVCFFFSIKKKLIKQNNLVLILHSYVVSVEQWNEMKTLRLIPSSQSRSCMLCCYLPSSWSMLQIRENIMYMLVGTDVSATEKVMKVMCTTGHVYRWSCRISNYWYTEHNFTTFGKAGWRVLRSFSRKSFCTAGWT